MRKLYQRTTRPWLHDPLARLVRDRELVLNFCWKRRASRADVRHAMRQVMRFRDVEALRFLLRVVIQRGCKPPYIFSAVHRLEEALARESELVRRCLAA